MIQQLRNGFVVPLTIILGTIAPASPASAQHHGSFHVGHLPVVHLGHHGGFHGFPGYGYGYGATVPGSYAHGLADLVRAYGEYNQLSAQAAVSLHQARQLQIENRKNKIQAYHELRRLWLAERTREHAERRERLARYLHNRTKPKPERLVADQLDLDTETIAWPKVLRQDLFADQRQALELLFRERAGKGGVISAEEQSRIEHSTDAMQEELKKRIREFRSSDYVVAMRFLKGLSNEAGRASGPRSTQLANLTATDASLTSEIQQ